MSWSYLTLRRLPAKAWSVARFSRISALALARRDDAAMRVSSLTVSAVVLIESRFPLKKERRMVNVEVG